MRYLTPECDNKTELHNLFIVGEDAHGLHSYCKICTRHYYLRKDARGNPPKKEYARLFLRDFIQPSKPLYYKVHKDRMNVYGS